MRDLLRRVRWMRWWPALTYDARGAKRYARMTGMHLSVAKRRERAMAHFLDMGCPGGPVIHYEPGPDGKWRRVRDEETRP